MKTKIIFISLFLSLVINTTYSQYIQTGSTDVNNTATYSGNLGIGGDPGAYKFAVKSINNSFNFLVFGADVNGNTYGNHLLRIISGIGENFSINAFNASGKKLITDIGVNYAVNGSNSYGQMAPLGNKYSPMIRFDAESGSILLFGENGPFGANNRSISQSLNLGICVANSGYVGVGTTSPKSALQVTNGDIYIENISKGIIMKSPNGQCWRGTLDNSGNLHFSPITCP